MNRLQRAWYIVLRHIARVIFIAAFGLRVFHRRRLPREGGVLVVSNHQSYLDPVLGPVGMKRPFHPMARQSLFRFGPFRWLIRSLHAFPVKRGRADVGAIKEALRRLKRGRVVLMFPEGTRTRDGSIGRLLPGPVAVAARAGVSMVPMVVDGAYEAWPRAQPVPLPHPIRVAFGEPIEVTKADAEHPERVMAEIRERMLELQAELRYRAATGAQSRCYSARNQRRERMR